MQVEVSDQKKWETPLDLTKAIFHEIEAYRD
jgi:hypothetical protein